MLFRKDVNKIFKWLSYLALGFIGIVTIAFAVAYFKRNEIKQSIIARLNEKVNGTFAVEKVDFTILHTFPDFSVSLKKVTLHDTLSPIPVLKAEKIYLDLGFYSLFRNKINMRNLSIVNGDVFLYRSKSGYKNSSVFSLKKDSSAQKTEGGNYSLNINTIKVKDLRFMYFDSLKDKSIAFQLENTYHTLNYLPDVTEMNMRGTLHSEALIFNRKAGGFLADKSFNIQADLRFNKITKQLSILPTRLEIGKDVINIKGDFFFDENAFFSLNIGSQNILMANGLLYLNDRLRSGLKKFKVENPVDLEVMIRGTHNKSSEPQADVRFNGKDVNFSYQKLKMDHVTCAGQYLHRPDSNNVQDENSLIKIDSFKAIVENVGFEGKLTLTKLYDPVMDLSMNSRITASTFNKMVDTLEWVSRSGTFISSVQYKGRLEEYLDSTTTKYKGKLNGNFRARNGTFVYKPKNFILTKVNGRIHFTEKEFTIDSLSLQFNGSPVKIKGAMKNYIPFFIRPANKGHVTLEVTSPHLDLSFIATEKGEVKSKYEARMRAYRVTNVLNTIQQKLQFDVALFAKEFSYKKFRAQNIKGNVSLDGEILEAPNIQMTVAKGQMNTRLLLRDTENHSRVLSVHTTVRNADIQEFFRLFNNFNQKTIGAENLGGVISATADFTAGVRRDYSIDPPSMKGNITCVIRDGQLLNFEPLENISNFLFKKRDFSDVQFAELNSSFDIDGLNLDIDRMEIQSSVLSFFVQGRYSFKDSTSLSLQIPLSNLKKRDRNFKPENVGTDAKRGMSVYLHVFRDKDINSKISIAYDPFKKWVK